jgi:alkylation response protein AidB-like acyl-CoA dehydrogenase
LIRKIRGGRFPVIGAGRRAAARRRHSLPEEPIMAEQAETIDRRKLAEEVRTWIAKNRPPDPGFKLPQTFLEVESEEQFKYLQAWQRKVYEAGYLGVEWPEAYGGRGLPAGTQRAIDQEVGRAGLPFMVNYIGLAWAGPTIMQWGTEAQKERYLKKILSCEEVWCQGFSEPGSGSDLASLTTSAVKKGDRYLINGHKVWTTQAEWADWMVLLARTDPEERKYDGISYFLFPMKSKGVEIRPLVKMTGEGGFNQVVFEDVEIPAFCLLGKEGQGWQLAIATLMFERGASEGSAGGSSMIGAPVKRLIALAGNSRRGGRPALEDPYVRDRIAQLAIEETALFACSKRYKIAGLVEDRPTAIPFMGKLVASEFVQRLTGFAQEIQGPSAQYGFGAERAQENGFWQRAYMNTFGFTIGGGTSEIQRNIIGERILGLAKSK